MFETIRELFKSSPKIPSDSSGSLYAWEKRALSKARCPDCGGHLLKGPRGGMAINIKCEDCGNKFNVAFLGGEIMGHRLT